MAILVDEETRVVIQGITGHQGRFHCEAMKHYGTKVLAGVTPGKGGETVNGVPVLDSMAEAVAETAANTSMLLVPAPYALDAAIEAIDSGIELLIIITERIPVHDAMMIMSYAKLKGTRVIGPNSPGVISPGKCKVGIMPDKIFKEGHIGIASRSGTLTYEIVSAVTDGGFGQSTCAGLGGDPIIGTDFATILEMFETDTETEAVVIVGEIGGTAEEEAAEYIRKMKKKVYAYIAGRTAPPGRRMGHAGAIISRGRGTAESKVRTLTSAGARVASFPDEIADLMRQES